MNYDGFYIIMLLNMTYIIKVDFKYWYLQLKITYKIRLKKKIEFNNIIPRRLSPKNENVTKDLFLWDVHSIGT